jgi:hypothetical protein
VNRPVAAQNQFFIVVRGGEGGRWMRLPRGEGGISLIGGASIVMTSVGVKAKCRGDKIGDPCQSGKNPVSAAPIGPTVMRRLGPPRAGRNLAVRGSS